ncbi:helix-turn-helix domain-containing protein [Clostridium sp. TF11-13AC]|nr:helix-turn-helix domain-containing protein [Clostridium sp. TF11-13AC]
MVYCTLETNLNVKGIVMTGTKGQWFISDDTKTECITALVPELKLLRAKANISQDDLAKILSISRQTYCQIENGNKDMS